MTLLLSPSEAVGFHVRIGAAVLALLVACLYPFARLHEVGGDRTRTPPFPIRMPMPILAPPLAVAILGSFGVGAARALRAGPRQGAP